MECIKGQDHGATALPCLNSNNCTETPPGQAAKPPLAQLSTQHKKSAFILQESVQKLADDYGIDNLGFLTLTFKEHITCFKEAQRRFHSLKTHILNIRYKSWLRVFERQKSGRIHYHLLVVLDHDIRTGIDFDELAKGKYSSASQDLRNEWSFWRKTAPQIPLWTN